MRLRDETRLLKVFLSEGNLVRYQWALTKRFCVIRSQTCPGIELELDVSMVIQNNRYVIQNTLTLQQINSIKIAYIPK